MAISTQGNTAGAIASLARKRKGLGTQQGFKPTAAPITTQPIQALAQSGKSVQQGQAFQSQVQSSQQAGAADLSNPLVQQQLQALPAGSLAAQGRDIQKGIVGGDFGKSGGPGTASAIGALQSLRQMQVAQQAGQSQSAVNTGRATPAVGGPTSTGTLTDKLQNRKKKLPLGANTVTGG